MRYAVIFEKADNNYAAYVPDLPGCVSTGNTLPEVEESMRAAIRLHIEGLQEDGLEIPQPTTSCEYLDA